MILPNNGKVVIIDDKPDDVIELIGALSKAKVPFVHYKEEDLSDLPESPIENVRLIFLDLELVTDVYLGEKNITSPIKTRLEKIIKPNTIYALVIWSKKENDYKQALLNDFNGEFNAYKPIFHTSLPKAEIKGLDKIEAMERIKKELKTEMTKFSSFNAFLVWESIVNESSGKLTNDVTSLYLPDESWDNKTKYLLYKLAVAYSGKTAKDFDDIAQLKNALYTLTMTFTDNIENSINNVIDNKFSGLVNDTYQQITNFTSVINRLLLISESSDDVLQPGNVFFCIDELNIKLGQVEHDFEEKKKGIEKIAQEKRPDAFNGLSKKINTSREAVNSTIRQKTKDFNRITVDSLNEDISKNRTTVRDEILSECKYIELNITPLCDYAQKKAVMYRILPGIIAKLEYRKHFNAKNAYSYISEADFKLGDNDYFFIFDFRFLYSNDGNTLKSRFAKYRLKQQLLSDVQLKLGAHINRTGVLFVPQV